MMSIRTMIAVAALIFAGAPSQARPVVVELFTSQGCSSCPPAEAVLFDLAREPSVLALAFHVDYWDRLGWRDPFSSPEATARQRAYAKVFGGRQIYTPQMVIDGRSQVVGSRRGEVAALIRAAASDQDSGVALAMRRADGGITIEIGTDGAITDATGRVLLIGFDPQQETAVARGENAGRTILQANVVRSLEVIAEWDGHALSIRRPLPAGGNAALILQVPDGRVLGAVVLDD